MSRALTGNAKFFPTFAAATTFFMLHWLLDELASHSKTVGHFIKGVEVLLVKDGQIVQEGLRKTNMTEHDLMEALRSSGKTVSIENVKAAFLKRSGKVSVISD